MSDQDKGKSKISEIIYRFSKKHWIWNTVILFLPAIWVPVVVNLFGNKLFITYNSFNEIKYTLFGIIITVCIYVLVFIFLLINNLSAHRNELDYQNDLESVKSSYDQLEYILACSRDIYMNQYDTVIDSISNFSEYYDDPSKQIKIILQKIADCMSKLSKIDLKKVNVTLAYQFADHEHWHWADHIYVDNGLSLEELMNNRNSAFYQILSGNREFLFQNSKKEAEDIGYYVQDKKDITNKNIGSIVCKGINVGMPETAYIRAILTISTYGKKFVNSNDASTLGIVESNIRDIILPEFELPIQIELALLYLKKIQQSKSTIL